MEWNRLHREGVCTRSRGASACKKIHEGLRFRLMACQATILFSLVAFLSLSLSLSFSRGLFLGGRLFALSNKGSSDLDSREG